MRVKCLEYMAAVLVAPDSEGSFPWRKRRGPIVQPMLVSHEFVLSRTLDSCHWHECPGVEQAKSTQRGSWHRRNRSTRNQGLGKYFLSSLHSDQM
jgi:hypothetical protein